MSITAIKPNGGTPFEQIVRTAGKRPVVRVIAPPRVTPVRRRRTDSKAPARTIQQRLLALQRANEIRSLRAQLKRDIKAGRETITPLLLDPPAYLETAKVVDMMLAVPKFGSVKVNRILKACAISPSKTIGGLSQRQRAELVELMGRRS